MSSNDAVAKRPDIRVVRKQDVADITRGVVQGKAVLPDLMAGLHRTLNAVNKSEHIQKQVQTTLLEANFVLAQVVKQQQDDIATLTKAVAFLTGKIEGFEKIVRGELSLSQGS